MLETTRQDWEKRIGSLTLSREKIIAATGYGRAAEQLEALHKAGIPADRRPDGSVRARRHHIAGVGSQLAQWRTTDSLQTAGQPWWRVGSGEPSARATPLWLRLGGGFGHGLA
ncbi:DUF4224 domain-containing protein [Cupriavidus basilensis]|uniref:DUF4224 domain-containing protein n=1 Tax=Cupriavidus basilensis TaxID=68895 RepID=A0A643FZB0_9BURK|nr:DUF4224 domain-containing protein [Cupriavidus basilensis]QOT81917.1 DUF4224 domain-containing protein [Cupriavidus basilensis]